MNPPNGGPESANIRDLPWIREEELKTLGEGRGPIVLPDVDVVLTQARNVFEKARAINPDSWKDNNNFLKSAAVSDYLHTFMVAYHELLKSATNTTVYCSYKDPSGNLCGAIMHISVDSTGVYYQCPINKYQHVQPVP